MEFLWQLDMDNTLSMLILAASMAQILAKLVFMTKFNVNAKNSTHVTNGIPHWTDVMCATRVHVLYNRSSNMEFNI